VVLPVSLYGTLSLLLRFVARDGYTWWTSGIIPADRVLTVGDRLHSKHHVFLTPHQRTARRTAGMPVAHVVFGPRADVVDGRFVLAFALLATAPLPGERLKRIDPEVNRGGRAQVVWRDRYVLKKRPTDEWTWYLTHAAFEAYANQIEAAVKRNDAQSLHIILQGLTMLPLFHGVSDDARALIKLARSRWAHRTRRSAGPAKAPGLNVNDYLRSCRPRRGVAGRVYGRAENRTRLTLQDFHDSYANRVPPGHQGRPS